RQAIAPGDLGVAGFATTETAAFLQQARTRGTVNRPVHPSPAEQFAVRRVHDRVDLQRCDVSLPNANPMGHSMPLPRKSTYIDLQGAASLSGRENAVNTSRSPEPRQQPLRPLG